MKLRRIIAVTAAGYLAWRAVEAATRPVPCQPLRTVRVPPEPAEWFERHLDRAAPQASSEQKQAAARQFSEVLQRRMNGTYRSFRADVT